MVRRGLFQVTMAGICSSLTGLVGYRGLEGYVLRRQAGLVWRELSTFSPLYKIAYGELH